MRSPQDRTGLPVLYRCVCRRPVVTLQLQRAYDTHDSNDEHTSQTRKPSKTENHLSHTAQTCPRKKCHLRLTPPARSPRADSGRPRPVGAVARRLERVEDLRGKPQVRRRASHLSNEDALSRYFSGAQRGAGRRVR